MQFNLYTINRQYSSYLGYYDDKVRLEHGVHSRPYVGIVFEINEHKYFAPLSSPRDRFRRIPDNQIDFIKLENGALGGINLNNMIPVIDGQYNEIEIDINDTYGNLLIDQLDIINSREVINKISNNSKKLLTTHIVENNVSLQKRCCDWEKLEKAARNYDYIINNSWLSSKIYNNELMLDQDDPHIINHIIKDREGNIIEKKPTLKLVDGNLSVNPDYNYAHLEESMYQTMVDDIKKGEGKANQLKTHNKTKDNDYER